MARPRVSEVRKLTDEEILDEILALRRLEFALRLNKATGHLSKTHEFKHTRRRIAQLHTVLRERQLSSLAVSTANRKTPVATTEQENSKRINAWITKDSKPVEGQLMINLSYTMNFMVGEPLANCLAISATARDIDHSEIIHPNELESKGLETSWIISSTSIHMESCPDSSKVSVVNMKGDLCQGWLAKFPLYIPIQGNSETVKLLIKPLSSKIMSLDVLILARGEVFRQFELHLNAKSKVKTGTEKVLSVAC